MRLELEKPQVECAIDGLLQECHYCQVLALGSAFAIQPMNGIATNIAFDTVRLATADAGFVELRLCLQRLQFRLQAVA